jgi:nucleolin
MSKNLKKIEKIENSRRLAKDLTDPIASDSSDLEDKPSTKNEVQEDSDSTLDQQVKPIKTRKPYTMSKEKRQAKSENMKIIHSKKMENVQLRKEQKQKLADDQKDEIFKKVQMKLAREKKQREKLAYKELMDEQTPIKTKKNKKVVVESSSESESSESSDSESSESESSEEEVIIKKSKKPTKKTTTKSKPKQTKPKKQPKEEQEEEQFYPEPNYYYRPTLTFH